MSFRIIVCVKPVPDPEHWRRIRLDPVTGVLNRQGIPLIINPLDRHALEIGLRLREAWGGRVIAATMAPAEARPVLLDTLAMGADEAIVISDPAFRGSDTLVTSRVLAAGIGVRGGADFVITGQQSIDGSTGQVGPQLAHFLGIPSIGHVMEIRVVAAGVLHVRSGSPDYQLMFEVGPPVLLSVTRDVCSVRRISLAGIMQAEKKPMRVLSAKDTGLEGAPSALEWSPTRVSSLCVPEISRRRVVLRGEPEETVRELLAKLREAGYPLA